MRELPGSWRAAAVAVLLAVTVAGLRARGTFSRTPDSALSGASRAVLVTALAVAEGFALIAFILLLAMARPRKSRRTTKSRPGGRPSRGGPRPSPYWRPWPSWSPRSRCSSP